MARFNTNVSAKSHERVKLGGFRGIDTSSAPIEVENYRSTEMRNMISRNGLNRKRHGWAQQELNIGKTFPNTFEGAIQGIYGFKFAGETDTRTIVYANCSLWHQAKKGDPFEDVTPKNVTTLKDRPCQFYLIGDALYILGCGEFFVVERGENNGITVSLMSERAYVPTTMLKIASDQYNASTTEPIERVTFEPPNMLNPWRKDFLLRDDNWETIETNESNKLIVSYINSSDESVTVSGNATITKNWLNYTLSAPVTPNPNVSIFDGKNNLNLEYLDYAQAYLIKRDNVNFGFLKNSGKLELLKSYSRSDKVEVNNLSWEYNLGGQLVDSEHSFTLTPNDVFYEITLKKEKINPYKSIAVWYTIDNNEPTKSIFNKTEPVIIPYTKQGVSSGIPVECTGNIYISFSEDISGNPIAEITMNPIGGGYCSFDFKILNIEQDYATIKRFDVSTIDGEYITGFKVAYGSFTSFAEVHTFREELNRFTIDVEIIDNSMQTSPPSLTIEPITEYQFSAESFLSEDIYVKYPYEIPNYKERITQCAISTLFGVDGHSDRLFVAGNENVYGDWASNCVVQWSEIDNYTYFPDVNYTRLGTQATAINGMQRLNDDSLCLFKESSTTEPTIYVMYGEYDTDKEGNTTNIFRTYAGNVAEGLIAPNSTGNLAGDILMLSSNGVYGVEMDANVVSTSKYTKERGLPIKRFIKEYSAEELKKACSIVRDDRYILCIGDKCFVAESRYSYKPKGSPRDTFSYEWYVWDNIPALCFSEIDGELYFGTADGRLCKFDDKFTDRSIDDFGAVTVGYVNPPFITVDSKIEKDDTIHIKCKGLTGRIGTFEFTFDTTNKTFEFTYYSENRLPFYIGQELLIDSPLLYLTIIDLLQILDDNNQFAYKVIGKYTPKFENASIKNGKKTVFLFLDNKFCKVLEPDIYPDIDDNTDTIGNQVKVSCEDFTFNLFWNADTTNNNCNVYKYTEKNVVAEWYSNTIDFGVPDYSKTLLGFTVVPERIEGDSVQFGYITREVDNESDVKQLRKSLTTVTENPLNLDGLSLYLLSFNTFQTSFTKKVKVRNFNYLMWFFKSDSPTDTAINNVLFDYKINHKNKGVN